MDRIKNTFEICEQENRKAVIAYVTAGCPDLETTESLILKLIEAGADIIELGVPFSDPTADGPVIQEASQLALENGTTLEQILQVAANVRKKSDNPIILFTYYNVLLANGLDETAAKCAEIGIDGMLIVDLPFEHTAELTPTLRKHGLSLISLIAPTTPPERAAAIAEAAEGFIYCITSKGVTGGQTGFAAGIDDNLRSVRETATVPVAAGFGIDSAEKAAALAPNCDGIVIGSAIMRCILKADEVQKGIASAAANINKIAEALKQN
ncbi:tryptophan synthase subunit alpha [Lentisphaerota bacterium ZTH]|nr:tryptophan synthase subunit alpha [Lentisphaerota bacterium]WET05402.1 tryptophan synthase subunit alpha [Lentisphaerota bacterium ZTH]